jgi:hypothetical protein
MDRREFLAALAAAGATLAARRAVAGPATSGMRSNFAFKKEDTPVILEVAINGSTTKKTNPTAPETPAELAKETIKCLDAGATIIHAHSNKPNQDVAAAARAYIDAFTPVRKKHPHGIIYPTANFDPAVYHENRTREPHRLVAGDPERALPPDRRGRAGQHDPARHRGRPDRGLRREGHDARQGLLVVRLLAR